jgi:hypothetical protein
MTNKHADAAFRVQCIMIITITTRSNKLATPRLPANQPTDP